MNRRRFLASMLAGAAAPIAAKASALGLPSGFTVGVDLATKADQTAYVLFCHPSMWRDIWELYGKGRWEAAYRRYREARRAGECLELKPAQVMERFATKACPPPASGEIGRIDSFRIITSEHA